VGMPVQKIMLSRTENVFGAQFTLTQPLRSRPLKRGVKDSCAGELRQRRDTAKP
jgi:hypothetical protein